MQDAMDLAPEAAPSFSLHEYAGILRRRRAIILQAFVIVLVAGVLVTLFQAPVYQTGGKLLVEAPSYIINSINTTDPLADLFRVNSQYSIATQIELLQNGTMRQKVADKIGPNVPGFTVGAQEGTSIITVGAEGDNPDNIANAVNTLMHIYVDDVANQSGKDLQNAIDFTTNEADKADQKAKQYEGQIQSFKRQHNTPDMDISRAQAGKAVEDLTSQYNGAIVDYQTLEAQIGATSQRLAEVKAHPLQNPLDNLGVPRDTQALLDPAIQEIDKQIAALVLQKDLQTSTEGDMGPANPTVRLAQKQLTLLTAQRNKLLKSMLVRESSVDPNLRKLEDDLVNMGIQADAKARQITLYAQQLDKAKQRLAMFPEVEFSYADLQDRLADARGRSASMRSKLADLQIRLQTLRKPAKVLEEAPVPGAPVKPKKAQNILFAALLGLFAGLCLALLQEMLDDRINSPEDAERALALPNLGYIPMIEEEGLRLIRDISTFSPLMESYRTLRTNINFAAVGRDVRSLLVSSSVPAEGKSTTCANLAMAMALDGKRVIIVDADLRRPAQHKLFKTASSPGLTDILVGTHTIEDVIQPTKVEGVSIIPAGSPPPNPAELLGSAAMGRFLGDVESMADIVLFDSPPTLAVADAVVLAARVDGVLLVIGYGDAKKANTRTAKSILTRANAHILGTVLNRMVGPSSGYYYGKYYVPTIDTASLPGGSNGKNGANGAMNGANGAGEAEGERHLALVAESAAPAHGGESSSDAEDAARDDEKESGS